MDGVYSLILVCKYNDKSDLWRKVLVISKRGVCEYDQVQWVDIEWNEHESFGRIVHLPLDTFVKQFDIVLL